MKSQYRKQNIVMVLCLLLGGFSMILYMIQAYTAFWGSEVFGEARHFNVSETENRRFNGSQDFNRSLGRFMPQRSPEVVLTSPFSLTLLFNGIILLLAGISIWSLVRDKEIKSVKEKLTSILLLPEERTIIEELRKSKGAITQSQLVKNTGLSKVKIHRVVNKLVAKGIVKKHSYGLTNKIVLEKEV